MTASDWLSINSNNGKKLISCKPNSNSEALPLGHSCIFRTNKRSCSLFQFWSEIRRGSAFYIIYCNNHKNIRNRTFLYYNFSILPVIDLQYVLISIKTVVDLQHIMSKRMMSMKTHWSPIYNVQIHGIYEDCIEMQYSYKIIVSILSGYSYIFVILFCKNF